MINQLICQIHLMSKTKTDYFVFIVQISVFERGSRYEFTYRVLIDWKIRNLQNKNLKEFYYFGSRTSKNGPRKEDFDSRVAQAGLLCPTLK